MNNLCLVTKLKGTVNNPSLPFLNEAELLVSIQGTRFEFSLGNVNTANDNIIVRLISSDSSIADERFSVVAPGGNSGNLELPIGDYQIGIRDIRNLKTLTLSTSYFKFDLSVFLNAVNLTNLTVNNASEITGKFSDLVNTRIAILNMNGNAKIEGSLKELCDMSTFQRLYAMHSSKVMVDFRTDFLNNNNITHLQLSRNIIAENGGDISNLSKLRNLQSLTLNSLGFTGNAEDFFTTMQNDGNGNKRTSGTLKFDFGDSSIVCAEGHILGSVTFNSSGWQYN